MGLGREIQLILSDDERMQLDSLAHRSRTARSGAASADHLGGRGGARQQGGRENAFASHRV